MINKEKFTGIFPALITPFDNDGKVNYDSIKKLMDYNIAKGVKGFYICGSSGEVFKLSEDERKEYYKKCAEFSNGRSTLIAHIGAFSEAQAIEYAKICEDCGYDAISAVTPFYFSYTKDSVYNYYKSIMSACNLPMLLYYIPGRSGISFSIKDISEMLDNEKVMGIKFSCSDYFTFERLRTKFPDKIFYNGSDEMLTCGLVNGADGAIGTTYNLMGEYFVKIFELAKQNKFVEAEEIQHNMNEIIFDLLEYDCIDAVKDAITRLVGIDCGSSRPPCGKVTKEWSDRFAKKYANKFIRA